MAATMERLAQRQAQQAAEVDNIIANYKKDPACRKAKVEYFEERLQRLEIAWERFEETDTQIRALRDVPTTHEYFASGLYDMTQSNVQNFRTHFEEKIQALKQAKATQNVRDGNTAAYQPSTLKVTKETLDHEATLSTSRGQIITTAPEITKLIRRYNALADSLRRLIARLNHEDHPKQFYELKIKLISQYWSQLEEYHQTIWELSNDPTSDGYSLDQHIELEELSQQWLIQLSTKLDQVAATSAANIPSAMSVTGLGLPKITLPKFDGDYIKWRQFYDLFIQMVHSQTLSNCQKLWYLKANVTGEAERLIRNFTLTDENYSSAWQMLKDRYENRRLLTAAFINKLLAQPSHSTDKPSAAAIRSLHDTTQECIMGLENIDVPTLNWDPILLHVLIKKLGATSHTLYEQSLTNPRELQSLKSFLAFLETRFQALEVLGSKLKSIEEPRKHNAVKYTLATLKTTMCSVCNQNHPLFYCPEFLKMTPASRLRVVQSKKLCVNCLREGHKAIECTLRGCKQCEKRHNSLLHLEGKKGCKPPKENSLPHAKVGAESDQQQQSLSLTTLDAQKIQSYVLLSTAIVKLIGHNGVKIQCRALLDPGSQINLITERAVQKLGISPTYHSTCIEKVGGTTQQTQRRVNVLLQSRLNAYSTRMEAYVLEKIVSPQPAQNIDISKWLIPKNVKLADPAFNNTDHIDILLSAEHFYDLLSVGQIKLGDELPTLQNTLLGWIIAGRVGGSHLSLATCAVLTEDTELNKTIEKFWKLEDVSESRNQYTLAERACETHFCQSTQRTKDGRFQVRLPFSDDPEKLGESKAIAERRLFAIERRLSQKLDLKQQYQEFMAEYIKLGHMEEVSPLLDSTRHYFLPHHCILKPDSSTTKLRVVFDASCKTTSNISLNDLLYAGPTIQDDLFAILLRFRLPRFVFTADIQKMYRQILLHPEDRKYHMALWRNEPKQPVRCFQLNTVTYGTTSAPYLAVKCLQRLAQEASQKYPLGASVLQRDFYIDDVMTGSDSLSTAIYMLEELIKVLHGAGFKLRKWCANNPRLLQNIPPEDQEAQLDFKSDAEDCVKTLGLTWLPKLDDFRIQINFGAESSKITKRTVSSAIARMFDPLGIMGPVIVTAKLFLQDIWRIELDWDAALPEKMHTQWCTFRNNLNALQQLQFPRHLFAAEVPKDIQLHVFCDASERAYGASVYVRSNTKDGRIIVRLLCAKSRLAPIHKVTIPRLELCAAKLGAELAGRVKAALHLEEAVNYFWSDSEIVLGWINSTASSFYPFVANRVASIQSLSIPQQWRHVRSKDNPADLLSRGVAPKEFPQCTTWLYGPPFLHGSESIWPPAYVKTTTCEIEKKKSALALATPQEGSQHFIDRIDHGNSFKKLQRVVAYVLRFTRHSQRKDAAPTSLTSRELEDALHVIVTNMQLEAFKDDIRSLKRHGEVTDSSPLSELKPFLDSKGLLRVGGRLEASNLSYDEKHPMLLPYKHPFTKMLMTDIHKDNFHVGPQSLLALTRQRFWPIKGKTLARAVFQRCVRCARARPKMLSQIMGNLPATRVQPARPFVNSGVDFCGPIWIHYRGRGSRPQKSYIAVFCCFATKAVHLEAVSDLTTGAFIGALKRFIGRRGHCRKLYCDNATNFVGARNQLAELSDSIYSDKAQDEISNNCASRKIEFHFIPPRAPHFGGLWEAAVKSAKHLLLKGTSSTALTYEELQTYLVEVEAILNSRPLTPMSSNPNDLTALTPGHFLVGEPLTTSIDIDAEPVKIGLVTRWKAVSKLKHEFWRRWSQEYLNELQHRLKWKHASQNVEPGTIVIIKEDNTPVMRWPLGRIIKTYVGEDGFVRVADVKTASGVFRRPIHSLSPLPVEEETVEPGKTRSENTVSPHDRGPTCSNPPSEQPKAGRSSNRHDDEVPKKRARVYHGSTFMSLLLTCLLFPFVNSSPVQITQLEPRLGIHFEAVGRAWLTTNEWRLIVYYDLRPYWLEYFTLSNGTQALQQLCGHIIQQSICNPVVTQFQAIEEELSKENQLLRSRSKRGAFNIVGNVARSLFGVLDSEYGQEISKTIARVKGNQNHLMLLLKNQTSVIDSTLNIIQRDQLAVQEKFKSLDEELKGMKNEINNPKREGYQYTLLNQFLALAIQLNLITANLGRIQAALVDVITDTQHGKLNPMLLSPTQLHREMTIIKAHLPDSLRLPIEHKDIAQLFKRSTLSAHKTTDQVIFQIKVPLVNIDTYELFRLWPIPALIHNTLTKIIPTSSYLAITAHRDQYYPISRQELSSCTIVRPSTYICEQINPVFHKGANVSACEVSLINDLPLSPHCQLAEISTSPVWFQLTQSNEWIYAVRTKTPINVVCNNFSSTLSITGSGLLKMDPDCNIKHDLSTIRSRQIYTRTTRTSYTKLGSFTEITSPTIMATNSTSFSYRASLKDLKQLKDDIHSQNVQLPDTMQPHDIHQYTVSYLSLALIVSIAIGWIFKVTRRAKKPVPLPRRHSLPTSQEEC